MLRLLSYMVVFQKKTTNKVASINKEPTIEQPASYKLFDVI